MTSEQQLSGPPGDLYVAVAAVVEEWLARCVVAGAVAGTGTADPAVRQAAAEMARRAAPDVLAGLHAVLVADVDRQRGNPLEILRAAVRYPTETLREAGVPTPERSEFDVAHFPDDVYGLGPATWSDVDPSLAEPGLVWGAWKAATVLARRRAEGLR